MSDIVRLVIVVGPGRPTSPVEEVVRDLVERGWNPVGVTGPFGLVGAMRAIRRTRDPSARSSHGGQMSDPLVIVDASASWASCTAAVLARIEPCPVIVVADGPGTDDSASGGVCSRLLERVTTRYLDREVGGPTIGDPSAPHRSDGTVVASLDTDSLARMGLVEPGEHGDGVVALGLGDLSEVVAVHTRAFPDSAMTHLGPRVLERYYRWQFIGPHPHPFAVGFWHDGRLEGFLFGGLRRLPVIGFTRRFRFVNALAVITHPSGAAKLVGPKLTKVLTGLRRGNPAQPDAGAVSASGSAAAFAVLSIAVRPEARGTGAAKALIDAAQSDAVSNGFSSMRLSVESENARAIRFYEREGWYVSSDGGQGYLKMLKDL